MSLEKVIARSLGKIMRTIFHSIKLLHLAQLATHTKVKERDLFLYDREEWRMCMREQVRKADTEREQASIISII